MEKRTLILGSGLTGLSAANYLFRRNKSFILMDNRLNPSGLKKISEITEDYEFINEFDTSILNKISEIVVSPGVPANNKVLKEARLKLSEIDYIVFYEKPFLKFERLLETYLAFAPKGFKSFSMSMPIWLREKLFQKKMLFNELKIHDKRFQDINKIYHYLLHKK